MSSLTRYPALPYFVGSTSVPRHPESIPFRCPTPGCGPRQHTSVTVRRSSGFAQNIGALGTIKFSLRRRLHSRRCCIGIEEDQHIGVHDFDGIDSQVSGAR